MVDIDALSHLSESLAYVDNFLDDIQDGKKLYLDPSNAREKHVIDFIHALYPDDFDHVLDRSLDTRPENFYITPDQVKNGQDFSILQVDTRVQPLHENLHNANHVLFGRASKIQTHNFVVAGADLHYRDRRDFQGSFDRSPNMFLHCKGDVVSLSQTIKLLRQVIDGSDNNERSILFDNTTERFTPILRMLNLDFPESINSLNDTLKKAGKKAVIAVVEEKNTALGRLKAIGVDVEKTLPPLPRIIPDKVFQATSSQEKIDDIRLALRDHRSGLNIISADALGGLSEHDPEFKYTFAGNDFAKALTTIIDKQNNPHVDTVLKQMDVGDENAGILFYDGGESNAERGLRDTDVFAPYLKQTHQYAEFPGAETKPLSQAVGPKSDYYKLHAQALQEIEQKEGRKADSRMLDNCVVLYMPLQQDNLDNPRYYAFKATSVLEIECAPDPLLAVNYGDDAQKSQRHYQKPIDRIETLAELEEMGDPWMAKEMAISKAIRGFSDAARIPKRKIDLKADFDRIKDLVVHCPYPLPEEDEVKYRRKLERQGLKLDVRDRPIKSIDDVRKTIDSSKALFFPNVVSKQGGLYWADKIFLPASVVVEKQLSNPKVNGMPVAFYSGIYDGDGNAVPTDFERISNHLKRANMVTQDMHHLYQGFDKMKQVSNYIKESALVQNIYDVFDDHKKVDLPVSKCAVTFLESATSAHPVDNDNAYILTVNCGLNKFDSISGYGMSGPMGAVMWGAFQLIVEGFDHMAMGVQDPKAKKTEGSPDEAMRKIMGDGYGVIAPDIFVRMWQMLQMDALQDDREMKTIAVAQGCGIGGLQEIAIIMAMKELGVPGADRIHLIIENAERELPSGIIAPHDVLLDMMDQRGDLSGRLGTYATTSPQETLAQIGHIKNQSMTYYPVKNPLDTIHPFEDVKNEHLKWLMGYGNIPPRETIRDVYNNVLRDKNHTPDLG